MNKTLLAALLLVSSLSLSAAELCDAVRANNVKAVKKLIADGKEINEHCEIGKTPLHIAVGDNNIDLAKLLLVAGADVNAKDDKMRTPLHYAYYYNSKGGLEKMIAVLKQAGADENAKSSDGKTPAQMLQKK